MLHGRCALHVSICMARHEKRNICVWPCIQDLPWAPAGQDYANFSKSIDMRHGSCNFPQGRQWPRSTPDPLLVQQLLSWLAMPAMSAYRSRGPSYTQLISPALRHAPLDMVALNDYCMACNMM